MTSTADVDAFKRILTDVRSESVLWFRRLDAIRELQGFVNDDSKRLIVEEELTAVVDGLVSLLNSTRASLQQAALLAISAIANRLRHGFQEHVPTLTSAIHRVADGDDSEAVRSAARSTLEQLAALHVMVEKSPLRRSSPLRDKLSSIGSPLRSVDQQLEEDALQPEEVSGVFETTVSDRLLSPQPPSSPQKDPTSLMIDTQSEQGSPSPSPTVNIIGHLGPPLDQIGLAKEPSSPLKSPQVSQKTLTLAQARIEKLEGTVRSLQGVIMEHMEIERTMLQNQDQAIAEARRKAMQKLRAEMETVRTEDKRLLQETETAYKEMRLRYDDCKGLLEAQQDDNEKLRAAVQEAESTVTILQSRYGNLKSEAERKLTLAKQQVQLATEEATAAVQQANELRQKVTELEPLAQKAEELESQLGSATEERDRYQSELMQTAARLDTVEAELGAARERERQMATQITDLKYDLKHSSAIDAVDRLREENRNLKAQLFDASQSSDDELRRQLSEQQQRISDLQKESESAIRLAEQTVTNLETVKAENVRLRQMLAL